MTIAKLDGKYGTLVEGFLQAMNEIGEYGLQKYKDASFEAQVAKGIKPVRDIGRKQKDEILNHAIAHAKDYECSITHDHFNTLKHQLAAAAFNLMMEYFYADLDNEAVRQAISERSSSDSEAEEGEED